MNTNTMALTSTNVEKLIVACLFADGEDASNTVLAEGLMHTYGFDPYKLNENYQAIINLLDQLPDNFKNSGGGGWLFLNACMTKENKLWGQHRDVENLIVLGIAINKVAYLTPRETWSAFPGGVPYFAVLDTKPMGSIGNDDLKMLLKLAVKRTEEEGGYDNKIMDS